jgi:hypothetical protein
MSNNTLPKATAVTLAAMLASGCSEPAATVTNATAPAAAVAGPQAYSEFDSRLTIRDVMNTLIDPSADALWNAVKFEMDADGEREVRPETDEDWDRHRKQAIVLIEGANALMIPGRRVAPPGATTEFPEYEYQPDEVDAKLREDWQSWLAFARVLQGPAFSMLASIEARDADLLSEYGAALDEACETCHSLYWYRSEAQ